MTILEFIRANQDYIKDIEVETVSNTVERGFKVIERNTSFIIYKYRLLNSKEVLELYNLFDIKNIRLITNECSLNFILGDPLGLLSYYDENGTSPIINIMCVYDGDEVSVNTLKFKRYEGDVYVVFEDEEGDEITLEMNTHYFFDGDLLVLKDSDEGEIIKYKLMGNDSHRFCSRCGRLKQKEQLKMRRGAYICKDKCERWIDDKTRIIG